MIRVIQAYLVFQMSIVAAVAGAQCFKSAVNFRSIGSEEFYASSDLSDHWRSSPFAESKVVRTFRESISERVNVDPIYLLEKQLEIFRRFIPDSPFNDLTAKIISGEIGRIEGVSCLEESILEAHLRKFGPAREFSAIVLEKDDDHGPLSKVHIHSNGDFGVNNSREFDRRIQADIDVGWKMVIHLHNHLFVFDNPYGDIAGTTVPSEGDLSYYQKLRRKFGLKQAWITNGFNTVKIEIDELESTDSSPNP